MPTVADQMLLDSSLVRKHQKIICAIADYSVPAPDTFFDEQGMPAALPTGFMQMGLITTDGLPLSSDVSTDDVDSVQTTNHTRSDVSSDVVSSQIVFQETSELTLALQYGVLFADMPERGTLVDFKRKASADQPLRRMYWLTQDRVGPDAFYRVIFQPMIQITDKDDRNLQRSDEEQHSFTFTPMFDNEYGTDMRELMDGPGWRAKAAPAPAP
jgi:hypothetical protein